MERFTKEDAKRAFIALLDNEGTATSYDVKMALRQQGFWALQKDVSAVCREIYRENEGILDREFTGSCFRYSFTSLEQLDPKAPEAGKSDADKERDARGCEECACLACEESCKDCDDCDELNPQSADDPQTASEDPSTNDGFVLEAYSINVPDHKLYIGISRNQARYRFSRQFGVPYVNVRVRKSHLVVLD